MDGIVATDDDVPVGGEGRGGGTLLVFSSVTMPLESCPLFCFLAGVFCETIDHAEMAMVYCFASAWITRLRNFFFFSFCHSGTDFALLFFLFLKCCVVHTSVAFPFWYPRSLLRLIEQGLEMLEEMRTGPLELFADRAFSAQLNDAVHLTDDAYRKMYYRDALKFGFFGIQDALGHYREYIGADKTKASFNKIHRSAPTPTHTH